VVIDVVVMATTMRDASTPGDYLPGHGQPVDGRPLGSYLGGNRRAADRASSWCAVHTTSTRSNDMSDLETTVDTYLAAYGEPDATARLAQVEQAFTAEGRLVDPPLDGAGRQGISDMMAAVQGVYPAHTFRRVSGIDEHHGFLRFAWELSSPDGTVALTGLDVGEVDEDGRLVAVVGFLGPLPEKV
jgi:hypothetical protein